MLLFWHLPVHFIEWKNNPKYLLLKTLLFYCFLNHALVPFWVAQMPSCPHLLTLKLTCTHFAITATINIYNSQINIYRCLCTLISVPECNVTESLSLSLFLSLSQVQDNWLIAWGVDGPSLRVMIYDHNHKMLLQTQLFNSSQSPHIASINVIHYSMSGCGHLRDNTIQKRYIMILRACSFQSGPL